GHFSCHGMLSNFKNLIAGYNLSDVIEEKSFDTLDDRTLRVFLGFTLASLSITPKWSTLLPTGSFRCHCWVARGRKRVRTVRSGSRLTVDPATSWRDLLFDKSAPLQLEQSFSSIICRKENDGKMD